MAVKILCRVSGCGLYHDVRMHCKVAANQLRVGKLDEPYLSWNREKAAAQVSTPESVSATGGEMAAEVSRPENSKITAEPAAAAHKRVPSKIPVAEGVGGFRCPTCGHFDKRKWMRDYMKKYRKRLKEALP